MIRFNSTYRPPSNASVQPRAPMRGGTYGTLSRRPSPGMNSATPFGYPAQQKPKVPWQQEYGLPTSPMNRQPKAPRGVGQTWTPLPGHSYPTAAPNRTSKIPWGTGMTWTPIMTHNQI